MRKHGPWSRASRIAESWPAAAGFLTHPPARIPQVDDLARILVEAKGGPADFRGLIDRQMHARQLHLVDKNRVPTLLGRIWAALWSRGPAEGDLACRIAAAGTLLAADGPALLCLLAASGGAGSAAEAAEATARACRKLAEKPTASGRFRDGLRSTATDLEHARGVPREIVRLLRARVGWLSYFGLSSGRMYDGRLRPGPSDPARVRLLAEVALHFRPAWELRSPHMHMAVWLATATDTDPTNPGPPPSPEDLLDLLGEAEEVLEGRLGSGREIALLLSALSARRGRRTEPAPFYDLLSRLGRAGRFVRLPGLRVQVAAGGGSGLAICEEVPEGAAAWTAGAASLRSAAKLLPVDSAHRWAVEAAALWLEDRAKTG